MGELADLARRFGTPLYVYRLDRVRRAARDLLAALPDGTGLYYSLKANPHPAIVAELARLGAGAELSSSGETAAAAEAGVPGGRCLYTGPGKTRDELAVAVRAGVRLFSVESVTDRDRLAAVAAEQAADVRYAVRLNGSAAAGSGLRMTGRSSQFGVDPADAAELAAVFRDRGRARPVGAHVFSATNIHGTRPLLDELALNAGTVADALRTTGTTGTFADLGGGFAAPFAAPGDRADYRAIRSGAEAVLDRELPGWRRGEPHVAFESGRYLTADCGTLLTTVLDVKRRRGQTYVVLDAGIHTLGGIWGTGRLPVPSARPDPGPPGAAATRAALVGPLCTPLDVLNRAADVPDPAVGDLLSVPNVGAYGLTASLLGFLSRPVATEVVVDGDEVAAVRRLELHATGGTP